MGAQADQPRPSSQALPAAQGATPGNSRSPRLHVGFTKHVHEFTEYHPEIILLDCSHIEAMVAGLVDPDQLLHSLFSWTSRRGGSYVPLARLLLNPYPPELPCWSDPGDKLRISNAAEGVSSRALLMTDGIDTSFTGMTAASDTAVLLTCDTGVLRLNVETGASSWELPLSGCFGPALSQSNEAFLVTCGSAVVAWDGRALTAAAGCFKPRSQLLPGWNRECWMFSTTGPTGHPYYGAHTLTRLGPGVGEERPYAIQFNGAIKQVAVTAQNTLYVASSLYTADLEIADGMGFDTSPGAQAFVGPKFTDVPTLQRFGEHTMLSAGSLGVEVGLYATDLRTREHTLLLRVAASSATALAALDDGTCLLLLRAWESDWLDRTARTRPVLLRIGLPQEAAHA